MVWFHHKLAVWYYCLVGKLYTVGYNNIKNTAKIQVEIYGFSKKSEPTKSLLITSWT